MRWGEPAPGAARCRRARRKIASCRFPARQGSRARNPGLTSFVHAVRICCARCRRPSGRLRRLSGARARNRSVTGSSTKRIRGLRHSTRSAT